MSSDDDFGEASLQLVSLSSFAVPLGHSGGRWLVLGSLPVCFTMANSAYVLYAFVGQKNLS